MEEMTLTITSQLRAYAIIMWICRLQSYGDRCVCVTRQQYITSTNAVYNNVLVLPPCGEVLCK